MAEKKCLPELISAVQLTKKNSPKERQSYGKRIVKYYELELILDGSGTIITEQQMIQTMPERLFIRKPGMEVEGFSPYYSYYIVFKDESRELQEIEFPLYIDSMGQLADFFKTIRNHFLYPDAASEFEIKGCLFKILSSVIKSISNRNFPIQEESVTYIKDHLEDPLTVSMLADLSGYSINHYINLFKKAVGETPSAFIRRCRIQRACELLEETNDTMETVARQCGFQNFSYFFRSFKKVQGQTPHEYRKMIRSYGN